MGIVTNLRQHTPWAGTVFNPTKFFKVWSFLGSEGATTDRNNDTWNFSDLSITDVPDEHSGQVIVIVDGKIEFSTTDDATYGSFDLTVTPGSESIQFKHAVPDNAVVQIVIIT